MSNTIAIDPRFKFLARTGYTARGVLYLIIGGLALSYALTGGQGETTGSRGAIQTLLEQPFGQVLVVLMIVGLLGYSTWRFIQAIRDTDDHGTSAKGLAVRGGLLVSALTHVALALWSASLLLGSGGSSGSESGSGGFLSNQLGQIVFILIGVAIAGAGIAHIYKGATAGFTKYVHIPSSHRSWAKPLCQFGLIARGVVWCMISWFTIQAAWRASQQDIASVSEALDSLHSAPYGPWLLGIAAAGLFAFGAYSCMEAIWRRINPG